MKIQECTLESYLEALSSKAPVPGGGSASALAGAYGVSLGLMVGALTGGKKKYAEFEERLSWLTGKLEKLKKDFLKLAEEDAEAFLPLSEAYRLPDTTEEERERKERVLEDCLFSASLPPLHMMEKAAEALLYMEELAERGSRLAVSDVGVGVQFLNTALTGAVMNVYINTGAMKNRERAEELNLYAEKLLTDGTHDVYRIYELVEKALGRQMQ